MELSGQLIHAYMILELTRSDLSSALLLGSSALLNPDQESRMRYLLRDEMGVCGVSLFSQGKLEDKNHIVHP
jgi:hypothetical protein